MLRLAVPVVVIQVGHDAHGGRGHHHGRAPLRRVALAAVALGNLYFFGLGVFGMGTLMVLDPVVAQAVGARDDPAVARGIQRGVLLALMIGVPATLLLSPAELFMALARPARRGRAPGAAYADRLAPGCAAVLPLHRAPPEPSVACT